MKCFRAELDRNRWVDQRGLADESDNWPPAFLRGTK
jgi:hypothetical protein